MNEAIEKIYKASIKFLNSASIESAYEIIVKESIKVFEGFEGSILLLERGRLNRVYSTNPIFNKVVIRKADLRHKALKESRPLLITGKEFAKQEKNYPVLKKIKARSIIIIPLFYVHRPMGVMAIFSKKTKPDLGANPQLVKLLGSLASLTLEKFKIHKSRTDDVQEILSSIYASALKFLMPLGPDETYRVIVDEAIKLVGGQNANIFLESHGELKRVFYSTPLSLNIEIRKNGNRYKAFKEKKAMLIDSKELSALKKIHPTLDEMQTRSIILVPLLSQNKAVGLLTVVSQKERKFGVKELEVLKLFGSFASSAIRKSQLYEEIKEALNTRDLFISLAAHELRTPLTTINGYIQLMLNRIRADKPIQNKWVMEMALESQRLKLLIDEFLEINRIRTGKLQFNWEEASIRNLIERAITNFKFNFPTRKIHFKDELKKKTVRIIADPEKIVQVLINIIENAHKYSKEGKQIYVTLKDNIEQFIIDITDEGQGIEEKDLPLVFKGFYKGENSKHEGMGLGLYLTKNIIDAHHGEIDIRSQLGKGTNVRIKLPKL